MKESSFVALTPDILALLDKLCIFFDVESTILVSSLIKSTHERIVEQAQFVGLKYLNSNLEPKKTLSPDEVLYLQNVKSVLNPTGNQMTAEDWKNAKKMAIELAKELDRECPGEEWKNGQDVST